MTVHDEAHADGEHAEGAIHVTRRDYVTGFSLAAVLTAIPFWLVMTDALHNRVATAAAVMILAMVQIVVHMIYFLHMKARVEGGWSLLALIFTAIIVFITLSGSLWVMYHLQINMMPGMQQMNEAP